MTAGTVRVTTGDVRYNGFLVAEGASDRVYLSALDHRIGQLSERRRLFFAAAHEIFHHALAITGANDVGMSTVGDALALIARFGQLTSADWPTSFTPDATSPAMIPISIYSPMYMASVPRLRSWTTSDFVGMPGAWIRTTQAAILADLEQVAGPRITFRLSDAVGPLLANVRAVLLHLIDALITMARLCEMEIWMLRRERSHILARIGRLPNICAFVLAIIAVCRCYGHRSEPDDHASLLIRRHLVSMGSCRPT